MSVKLTGIDLTPTPGYTVVASSASAWNSVPITGAISLAPSGATYLNFSSTYNFSAFINTQTVNSSTQIGNWSTTTPFFTGTGFTAATGEWIVPAPGKYYIAVTINYATGTTLTISLGSSINPYFAIQRISPSPATLLTGALPILSITLIRGLLGTGQVNITGTLTLNSSDRIALFYQANGATINVPMGGASTPGVVWSVQSLFLKD